MYESICEKSTALFVIQFALARCVRKVVMITTDLLRKRASDKKKCEKIFGVGRGLKKM